MAFVKTDAQHYSDIAAAIRQKSGVATRFLPSEMAAAISAITAGGVPIPPSYVINEAQRLVTNVQSHNVSSGFSFLICSDVHVANANSQLVESALHMGQGMAVVRRYLTPDFVGHLGDLTTGASTTTIADGNRDIQLVNGDISDAMTYGSLPQLRTVGNHDCLGQAYSQNEEMLTPAELYTYFGQYNTGATYGSETNCNYCYRDFASKKIRVILLDTSQQTPESLHPSSVSMTAAQYQFFADALAGVGSKSDAAQWGVIVLSHMPPDWPDHNGYRYMSLILKDYLGGASGSNGGATYSFANKNGAQFIGWFHGHVHCYKTDKIHYVSGGSVLEMDAYKIAIPNACFNRNNEYGATERWGVSYGESTTYSKTASSANDTAFCVITVDTANGVIYADRYGAGYDREIAYSGTRYTVTVNPGHATVSAPSGVNQGGSLTATVTVSGNYSIDSVVVTMGGTTLSGVYSSGTISIPNVTGDVVITVTTSGYNNIIDTIGYTDGKRLSTSAGTLSNATGYTTTGFIDLTPYVGKGETVVIRTSGVDMRSSTHSNSTWCYYRANETFVGGGYMNNLGDANTNGAATFDEDGNMTLTLSGTSYPLTSTGNRPKLRLAGYGSGANLIVTINEVIA